ncbi:protein polyglycylase TTLL10 isoform X1 [Poecilia latipinna]|uniref:protein polyglycylase TTLL10 isoform X1 n=1 Tax=Poecilia latipinna TaxID=48699 RepID=UPI00072ED6B7|nr:PREDICTED: inactive polyglycylase TTLL10 isoform X1 [Poecilia latipinna]XP_014873460.1 PREDICTED: inactive polyglycylase TTLL10 isoform X1 [Poecilia latipinna]XP_014873461.1 PREDICTED: inactive polyglycylase TTLL10 isoform X1 [Poecilia latipinna]
MQEAIKSERCQEMYSKDRLEKENKQILYGGKEEPTTEQSESPDCWDSQEMTSEGLECAHMEGALTREEGRRRSCFSVKQKRQCGQTGGSKVEGSFHRSKSRGPGPCSNKGQDKDIKTEEPRGLGPFYFFGGTNGAEVVCGYCERRGWKRIYNKQREDFRLKWCETKSQINYSRFKQGRHLVFQIPNNMVLTTKIGLLNSLREFERITSKIRYKNGHRRLKMEEFIPTTFRMDVKEEREDFFSRIAPQEGETDLKKTESSMWICKPTGLNRGKGIFLLKNQEDVTEFRLKLQKMEELQADRRTPHRRIQPHIVQRYIQKPLLLNDRKFDVRSYLLIASTAPYMVFFRHGYVRLTCDVYDPTSKNLSAHLTNQYMQKRNPLYSQVKEDTVWSMESFNAYVNERLQVAKGLPRDWVLGAFTKRMQQIMTQCFFAVKTKLDCRPGFFDLIGCDFMIDEDFKVWLLEMNCNPALHRNCEVLKEVIPRTVGEALDLTLELFNKCRLRQEILPLVSQQDFVLLYSGVLGHVDNKRTDSSDVCQKAKNNRKPREHKTRTEITKGTVASQEDPLTEVTQTETSPLHQSAASVGECPMAVRRKTRAPQVRLKLSKCNSVEGRLKAEDDGKQTKA